MPAPSNKPRPTISINKLGYRHILIIQSRAEDRPEWQRGAYMGYPGYVLHKLEKL